MTVTTLDAKQLYFATLAGCHAIVSERETLNAINVFPIQDGDTGDNMAATATAVIHHASLQHSIKDTLKSVANASMTGARGNSGMIFSQFFNALADFAIEEDCFTIHHFSELLQHASIRVRSAILNPIDGTMLTIMERWSLHVRETAHQMPCFKIALQSITEKLQDAVTQTKQALAVLKNADVVDAGALGFFHFVNGFTRFIADPTSLPAFDDTTVSTLTPHIDICTTTRPEHGRYCTEAMIKSEHIDQHHLMDLLKPFGESIVISANEQLCRFHLHTDTPWDVFESLSAVGQIYQPKVDDMLRQFQTMHERHHRIALVTDSNVDLPLSEFDKYQLHLIPLNIHIGHHDLLDKYTIQPISFYKHLAQDPMPPKTSCPSPLAIEQKLKPLAEHYDHVIVVSIAQVLSSTHDTIQHVAEKYPNIHVINSKRCSAAQGLLLIEAAKMIEAGATVEAIKQKLEALIPYTQFWFMVHDLTALIRSGRINKLIGKLAQFSGLKPFFSLTEDGAAHLTGKTFQESASLHKIIQAVIQRTKQGETLKAYSIVHADAQQAALTFAKDCEAQLGMPPAYIESVSVAVGVHAGSGCVGLAAHFEA